MLISLKYVVTFNTTGRTLKNQLNFKPGLTVILGENESGKSFVFEMIRYALMGSSALRGNREDYDKLEVTLKLRIRGKLYTIERSGNKATVNVNEAVGTSATNAYIRKVLGFGLDVFDITNNVNQGELDKLTKDMKPTERQKMIDEVTGLSIFESAEKECREESNNFRKLFQALQAQLVEPVEPAKPNDYEPSSALKIRLDAEIRNQAIRDSFQEMEAPEKPVKPEGSEDSIEHETQRKNFLAQRESLEGRINQLPVPEHDYSREELLAFLKSIEQVERGPLPSYTEEELQEWASAFLIRERESEPLKCQECGTIVQGKELPPEPPISKKELESQLDAWDLWRGHTHNPDLPEAPIGRQDIEETLQALEAQPERAILEKDLKNLGAEPEDRSEEANNWQTYQQDLRDYEKDLERYSEYLEKKKAVEDLPEPEPFLQELYEMSLRYETLQAKYESAAEIYEAQLEKFRQAEKKSEEYKKGSLALRDARKDVKRYLIPSLSKVSSQLLSEMTDGERRKIKIDESFDIWVDNQPVRTLSGSGVSVVNLALRVALGQVLTQTVLPVFLADEIDANMADKRTKATHDSLRKLSEKLDQVIVITHKEFEGDNTIWIR